MESCEHESQYVDGHWRCLRCGEHGCIDPCDGFTELEGEEVPRVTEAERAEALRVREVIAEDNSPR